MTVRKLTQTLMLFGILSFQAVLAQVELFSFTDSLDRLSAFEKDTVRMGVLEKSEGDEIRQAVLEILARSEAELAALDLQISKKRERLATLMERPEARTEAETSDESSVATPIVDTALVRNREALEIDLLTLENARKKALLISVYANDLILQLAAQATKRSQQQLLYKAPSLLNQKNWRLAYESVPAVRDVISGDIVKWVLSVLSLGLILIFALGPTLHRLFAQNYNNFIPTDSYPRWLFLIIFTLVLVANCFYFVFVMQDRYLELTFVILMVLNLLLAGALLKLLARVRFLSNERIVDGEAIVQERHFYSFFVGVIKTLVLASTAATVIGYSVLAMYVLHNVVITLAAILLFLSLRGLWISSEKKVVAYIDNDGRPAKNSLSPEGSLFRLTLVELGLAVGLFLVAARFWGVSLNNFEGQSNWMKGEFQVGSLTVEFSQVLSSILAFTLVFYFFKLIRWFLRERIFRSMQLSVSASEAVLAILGYMGFTFAIIASLNALGVQWENLAIIAGALSVGIGFGLQTIISNFVSGLILLFERPVRVGDWVILGNGLEGHIKKVNMRSTEIMTLERSSVLIPNSNLLSDTITNWTLHDKMGRQDIEVGVAYGSDTEQVKQVLLEVAAQHNLLRKYPQPQVLFRDFGDSSLDFVLRVFLKNIDDRHRVGSDLRFAMDKSFRENNITIPFPQRDLHIKESVLATEVPECDKDP